MRPAHLIPHPSELQPEPTTTMEQWLRQGPWGYSMTSDSSGYVVCPCGAAVSDERTGQHAAKCRVLADSHRRTEG